MSGSTEHVRKNRISWEADSADYQERNAAQLDRWDRLAWGVWDLPEDDVHVLGDVAGMDALEYGCGACQFGIKVAMRGARVTGLDLTAAQLRHGQTKMAETGCGSRWCRPTASRSRSATTASTWCSAITG